MSAAAIRSFLFLALLLWLAPPAAPGAEAAQRSAQVRRELAAIGRLTPEPAQGRALFERCATCHAAVYPDLPRGWVPRIAGQHPRVIAKELLDYRHGVRTDARMQAVAGQHLLASAQDIANLAAYAGGVPWLPGSQGSGEPGRLRQGSAWYRLHCSACHGAGGAGSDAHGVPRLAGQDHDYLLRQLHDAIEGRRPTLSVPHARLLKPLDADGLEGLADHLSRATPGPHAAEPALTARRQAGAQGTYGHGPALSAQCRRESKEMTMMTEPTPVRGRGDRWNEACLSVAPRRHGAGAPDPTYGCVDWYCYELRGSRLLKDDDEEAPRDEPGPAAGGPGAKDTAPPP